MSATDFRVDLRDIRFALFEQLRIHEHLGKLDAFAEFDRELYDAMLEEAAKVAQEVVAPTNRIGDLEGCQLDDEGNVTTPAAFKDAYAALRDGGWIGLTASPEWGGNGLPHTLGAAVAEMMTGANPALAIYTGLTRGAYNLLEAHGSDYLKQTCLPHLAVGTWGGTMCLTEADAGTDVGNNRARAIPTEQEGIYHLEGEKIFISAGDSDLVENIVHLVLARTPGAPEGTAGLSIFAVPKYDFETGERNDARVVGLEHKMGINASATCVLALGARGPCRGWRIGEENRGMRIMFHMMNEARISVGVQGLATAAAAFLNARAYANERIQGVDITRHGDPTAPRVPIVRHPDVRRMLMIMQVAVQTMRSFVYRLALRADRAQHDPDSAEAERLHNLVDLLTPVCKAHCSDLGFEVTRLAVQTYGGYGYIREYPVEQHLRDVKIASIYEGTNGVQAMDLLGRKMNIRGGALFMQWLQESGGLLARVGASGAFNEEVEAIQKAQQGLGAAAMHLGGLASKGHVREAMLYATPFLELFGIVSLGIEALDQARVAKEALDAGATGADARFYQGKLLNLKFYTSTFLPKAMALSKEIRSGDASCLDEALFLED